MTTLNKDQYGLTNLYYAPRDKTTRAYDTPVRLPGAISLGISRSDSDNGLAADNGRYSGGAGMKTINGDLNVARFTNEWLVAICGWVVSAGGIGEGNGDGAEFALLGEVSGDQGGFRFVWYSCTATNPTSTYQTIEIDGTINYATETCTITSKITDLSNGNSLARWQCEKGSAHYDDFFEAVYEAPEADSTGGDEGDDGEDGDDGEGGGEGGGEG